jgi:signal transduction histidine kinase
MKNEIDILFYLFFKLFSRTKDNRSIMQVLIHRLSVSPSRDYFYIAPLTKKAKKNSMISKHFLLVLFLTAGLLPAVSQDTTYQRIIAAKDDTSKVMQLARYAKKFFRVDPDQSRKLNKEIISLSEKISFHYGAGIGYMDLAYTYAAEAEETQAITYYKKALSCLRKTSEKEMIAKCLLNLGNCIEATGDYPEATKVALEAVGMMEKTPYKAMLARAYASVGSTFYNVDNYPKALEYLNKALPITRELKDTSRLLFVLYALSATLTSQEKISEAMIYAQESIKAATAYGKADQLHIAHQSMADLLCRIYEGRKAIPHAQLSLKYAKESGSMHHILPATIILGEAYGKADRPEKQVSYLQQAQKISEENNILSSLNLIYKGLSEAYEKMENYKKAHDYYKKYIAGRDTVEGASTKKHIAELEVQYQTAQKEKTIAQKNLDVARKEMQLQKSRQMSVYSIGSAIVALMVAFLVFFYFRNKRKLDQKQLQSLRQEKEIHLLQAVMQGEEKERSRIAKDLHDGVAGMLAAVKMHFNSIALHVGGVLQSEGYQQGIRLLDEASHEVRKTSHNLMPEVLLQHGLEEAIRRYCNNVTNSSKLVVQYDSIGELGRFVDGFELSVYRIVQELLNNIVKHSRASEAIVQVTYQAKLLSITIEDNGIGLSKDDQQKDGIGLKSLQTRVKAMNGKIEFDSTAGQGLNAYLEFETAGLEKEGEMVVA